MTIPTADEIKAFVGTHLADNFKENDISPFDVADDLDLMKAGIIDSIGLIQLISAIEERFGLEVDFEDMAAESMTVFGPLCAYIAERAQKNA